MPELDTLWSDFQYCTLPLHHSQLAPHGTPTMTLVSWLASVGMAIGPPLVYADQFNSIIRRKDSTGFSMDVCGVLVSSSTLCRLS